MVPLTQEMSEWEDITEHEQALILTGSFWSRSFKAWPSGKTLNVRGDPRLWVIVYCSDKDLIGGEKPRPHSELCFWTDEMSVCQDMKGSAASSRLTTASPSPAGTEPPASAAWLGPGATVLKVGRFWNQIQSNLFMCFNLWYVISFCLCELHQGKFVSTKLCICQRSALL